MEGCPSGLWCGTWGVAKFLFGGASHNSRSAGPSSNLFGGGNWPLIGGQTTVEESGVRTQPTSGQGLQLVKDVVKEKVSECCERTGEAKNEVTIDLASEKASNKVLKSRNDLTRYILTNFTMVTTPQIYSALQNSLRRNPEIYAAIVKVVPVRQPNRHHRFDIWIKNDRWKEIRNSEIQVPKVAKDSQQSNPCNLATWNANGINSKLPAVRSYLAEKNLTSTIQEHLRTVEQYVPGIKDYIIFEKPKEKGFRGHCLYVHQYLAAHEVCTCLLVLHKRQQGIKYGKKLNPP
ncbi:hypothetical protein H4Q26_013790 [Puccinia striiformis f. sp. tritici PST-130]|uniref:Uncharacterized protein n=1 Tax=Puccinia striiformis f. sp. tritici PST-78 TaxID=1165861 RepID=A0A0L0V2U5_9BASI|nr:hypothetical protein H4Q26_013790 [Puccinia striiformis f. sp. tritici PST-130]KNE93630.1 hypothetical protein PSTG_13006 [Puccinia striiformis f. sp. tritici PST-78]